MDNLKPCPFCGSKGKVKAHNFQSAIEDVELDDVMCESCGIYFETYTRDDVNAVTLWNHRPIEDSLTAEVERLKSEVKRMKIGLRKLWYEFRDRRRRPYINHIEYQFYFAVEGKLEALLADCTNNDNKESEGKDE